MSDVLQYLEIEDDVVIVAMPMCVDCGLRQQTRGGSRCDACRAASRGGTVPEYTTRIPPGPRPTLHVVPDPPVVPPADPLLPYPCDVAGCLSKYGRQSDLTQHRNKKHNRPPPQGEHVTMTADRPTTDPLSALIAAPGMLARLIAARGGLIPIGRIEHVVRGDGVVLVRLIADDGIEG